MPRGRSLGMVMQLPDGDQTSMSRKQMMAKLDICMGGRVAEEVIFGVDNVTSGAVSDFQQATRLAKAMVTQWGFSSKLGIQYNGDKEARSAETQAIIDNEIRELLNDSYARAVTLITEHKQELGYIANALIEFETLSGSEIKRVSDGYNLNVRKRSQEPSRKPLVLPTAKPPPEIKPTQVSAKPKGQGPGNGGSGSGSGIKASPPATSTSSYSSSVQSNSNSKGGNTATNATTAAASSSSGRDKINNSSSSSSKDKSSSGGSKEEEKENASKPIRGPPPL
jgi:ATP-dependent metalloprotease